MNITLFYIQAEESDVDKIITPSLKGIHVHRYPVVHISDIKRIPSSQNGKMVCYLPSDELREVLRWAAEKEMQLVILTYPKDDTIAKSLGLTGSIEEILENIKTR